MRSLLIRWVVLAVAVWVTTGLISGIEVEGSPGTYLLVAAVIATINAVLGSILRLLTLPLIVLTLGLFSVVITAVVLEVSDWFMESFDVDGFGPALAGAVVIAIVTLVLDLAFLPERRRRRQRARDG